MAGNSLRVAGSLLVVGLLACGESGDGPTTAVDGGTPAVDPAAPSPDTTAAAVDVCALVSAEDVAAAVGAAVLRQGRGSDYGLVQGCEYDVEPLGGDRYGYYAIWLGQPHTYLGPEQTLAVDLDLGQTATMEMLDGLGDEAFVIHNASEGQAIVHILLRERLAIEIKAERFEDGLKLAALVLDRL